MLYHDSTIYVSVLTEARTILQTNIVLSLSAFIYVYIYLYTYVYVYIIHSHVVVTVAPTNLQTHIVILEPLLRRRVYMYI
jgi:hypothetical protein